MNQWGFEASIYSPSAKSWWLLREHRDLNGRIVEELNARLGRSYFIYRQGWVDFWKGF